jgi:hypothetical protein
LENVDIEAGSFSNALVAEVRLAGVLAGAAEQLVRVAARGVVADETDRETGTSQRGHHLHGSPGLFGSRLT